MRYSRIQTQNWRGITAYADSIPHLLHWDLAYLWILEKPRDERPQNWEGRIAAWRRLVSHFIMGDLSVEVKPIVPPLLRKTERYGIYEVHWLKHRKTGKIVGTLSPTVLVRPLPDWRMEDWTSRIEGEGSEALNMDALGQDPIRHRLDEWNHFLQLTLTQFQRDNEQSPFIARLIEILLKEFGEGRIGELVPGDKQIPIVILKDLQWIPVHQEGKERWEAFSTLQLTVRDPEKGLARVFVPRCQHDPQHLLTKKAGERIKINGSQVTMECPQCGLQTGFPLARLFVWYPGVNAKVIAWQDRNPMYCAADRIEWAPPPKCDPANPKILYFEWGTGTVGAGANRWLTLEFDREVEIHSLEEIFHERLLIPGDQERFHGLPVKHEWMEAICPGSEMKKEGEPAYMVFLLNIQGWPSRVKRLFTNAAIQFIPGLSLGIHPDPTDIFPSWNLFRIFLAGTKEGYHLRTQTDKGDDSFWLHEVPRDVCGWCNISQDEPAAGVSYDLRDIFKRRASSQNGLTPRLNIGIDFGTTTSVIYWSVDSETKPKPWHPSSASKLISWLAPQDADAKHEEEGFLPLDAAYENLQYEEDVRIPSALWHLPSGKQIIRWGGPPPEPGAVFLEQFKWQESQNTANYLAELLGLATSAMAQEVSRAEKITLALAIGYPLAFSDAENKHFVKSVNKAIQLFSRRAGLDQKDVTFRTVNESEASARSFGGFNPEDVVLLADLGGATLDVALCKAMDANTFDYLMMGSLLLGGERIITAMAEDGRTDEVDSWKLRDQIRRGQLLQADAEAVKYQKAQHRFSVLAIEFLRTMIAAYRQRGEKEKHEKVTLYLLGKGWHLVEAFDRRSETLGREEVFEGYYRSLISLLGDSNLEYRHFPNDMPDCKDLVARGVWERATEETEKQPKGARLPVGRDVVFMHDGTASIKLDWWSLIGPGDTQKIAGLEGGQLASYGIKVDLSSGPQGSPQWAKLTKDLWKGTSLEKNLYPEPGRILEWIRKAMSGMADARLHRGVLQILIEDYWAEQLAGRRPRS